MKMFKTCFPYLTEIELPADMAELVEKKAFDGLTDSARSGFGWSKIVPDVRMIISDGRALLLYRKSERVENRAAVQQLVEERQKKAEENGIVVSDDLLREFEHTATNEIIRFAPLKTWSAYILICPVEKHIYVSAANAAKCEDALSLLRKTLGSLYATPWGFGGLEATVLSDHLSCEAGKTNYYPLPDSLIISPFGKTIFTGSDSSLKGTFDGVGINSPEAKSLISGMKIRSVEMAFVERPADGQLKNLAEFSLHIPANGNLHFKGYDYDNDERMSEEEADDAQHVYAVEMLLVASYTPQIMRNLATFFGVADDYNFMVQG
ncbi:TPA: recombination-associated protein RdgC [Yersinia enterocolitica]|nr:recombination-associated protein RdgC [Yersinia enterocolitica]